MTFEQPASLNRYILPPIPFTWGFRWKLFKQFLPAFIFIYLLFFEAILLREWVTSHWEVAPFLRPLVMVLFLAIILPCSSEIQLWFALKAKKIIKLEKNCVETGLSRAQRIRWQNIQVWRFNNVPSENNYRVATVEYKQSRRHSIVLNKMEIIRLVSELKCRKQKDGFIFSILDLDSNLAVPVLEFKQVRPSILYLYMVGAFLFMEGLLFLLISLGTHDDPSSQNFTSGPGFTKFIISHFSNVTEYRHFILFAGGTLCICGAILMIWSLLLQKKEKARQRSIAATS